MLNSETKQKINNLRDLLVGKIPNPQGQVQQITLALIYKFMSDIDDETSGIFTDASFFPEEYAQYKWTHIMDPKLSAQERLNLYAEGLEKMHINSKIPQLFRNIFKQAFLPYRDAQTLDRFLKQINDFHYEHSEDLGDAFEYLLSCLSAAGDAGMFRTPRHIIDFIVSIVEPKITDKILDPACGTAGFLISAYKYLVKHNENIDMIKLSDQIVGYDISPDMVQLALVNLYLHQFPNPKIEEYDSLTSEVHWSERFECILANPPFMTPKGGIQPHSKFSIESNRSEVLFVDYIIEHLKDNIGKAGIIVPEGVIFQSANAYKKLRKDLIEKGGLWAVISLPAGIFNPYSGVKTSVLLLDRNIKTDNIIFGKITADGYDLGAQRREISKNDLPIVLDELLKVKERLLQKEDILDFISDLIRSVPKSDIAEDYNLSAERYKAEIVAHTGSWNMIELGEMAEIKRGTSITKRDVTEGPIPVIAGGKEPAYYHNESNRDGEIITVSGSGANAGYLNYFDQPIFASDGFTIKPLANKALTKYVFEILKSKQGEIYKLQSGGGQPHIYPRDLEKLRIPVPPITVQEQIVKELNGYNAIIEGSHKVINNWKPKIEINLNREKVKLEEIFELSSGSFLPSKNVIEGPYPVYGGNGINNYHSEFLIEKPTIVIGRVGEYCGAVYITKPKSWITDNALYITKYLKTVDQDYLGYAMVDANINQFAKQGGQPSISQQTVKEIEIRLPPIEIQQEIVAKIKYEQSLIDAAKELIILYEKKIKDKVESLRVE